MAGNGVCGGVYAPDIKYRPGKIFLEIGDKCAFNIDHLFWSSHFPDFSEARGIALNLPSWSAERAYPPSFK